MNDNPNLFIVEHVTDGVLMYGDVQTGHYKSEALFVERAYQLALHIVLKQGVRYIKAGALTDAELRDRHREKDRLFMNWIDGQGNDNVLFVTRAIYQRAIDQLYEFEMNAVNSEEYVIDIDWQSNEHGQLIPVGDYQHAPGEAYVFKFNAKSTVAHKWELWRGTSTMLTKLLASASSIQPLVDNLVDRLKIDENHVLSKVEHDTGPYALFFEQRGGSYLLQKRSGHVEDVKLDDQWYPELWSTDEHFVNDVFCTFKRFEIRLKSDWSHEVTIILSVAMSAGLATVGGFMRMTGQEHNGDVIWSTGYDREYGNVSFSVENMSDFSRVAYAMSQVETILKHVVENYLKEN